MDIFTDTDVEIYGSRETIRNDLIEFAQQYLELQTVDLTKTSFVSYIINVLSALSSNQLFYTSSIYNEGFLLTAQLTDSVYNLARWIGYSVPFATASTVTVTFRMPLNFQDNNVTFKFPYDYQVKAGDVIFTLDDSFRSDESDGSTQGVTVNVIRNSTVTVRDSLGFTSPVTYDLSDADNPYAIFSLPFVQQTTNLSLVQVPDDLELFQFYIKRLTIDGQVSDVDLYVLDASDDLFPVTYVVNENTGQLATINSVTEIDSYDKFIRVFDENVRAAGKWQQSEGGIFTLQPSEKKYIVTPFPDELELAFGNGVIGYQPQPGQWIFAFISTTEGQEGNSVPGSINNADRLLYSVTYPDPNNPTSNITRTQRISFDVSNLASAVGGLNNPTLTEIKSNAISNLTSKDRLVSGVDYDQFGLIIPEIPIEQSTKAILKRSDLKINEIDIFSQLIYDNPSNEGQAEVVPTRNLIIPVDSTGYVPTDTSSWPTGNFFIPRGSKFQVSPQGSTIEIDITDENITFETIFDIEMDLTTNSAKYSYTVSEVNSPTSVTSDSNEANAYIYISSVDIESEVSYTDTSVVLLSFLANVVSTAGSPVTAYDAKLWPSFRTEPTSTNLINTILDGDGLVTGFTFEDDVFSDYPSGEVDFYLKLIDNSNPLNPDSIAVYQFTTIIRQDLSEFMLSDITYDSTNQRYLIHNVPCVLSEYLTQTGFDLKDFEERTVQAFISNVNINDHRMLTDFVNLKFSDTTGPLTNMKYNEADLEVVSVDQSSVPVLPPGSPLVTYIINGTEGGVWAGRQNDIARWNGAAWIISDPIVNETVEINNIFDVNDPDNGKKLIYNGEDWIEPIFSIPFNITATVTKDPTSPRSNSTIVQDIKDDLLSTFSSKFGNDADIDRSEIIKVIRSVTGVQYVKLIEPSVDIRFKYDIDDLSVEELFDYTPQLVAFTEDTISITVVTS